MWVPKKIWVLKKFESQKNIWVPKKNWFRNKIWSRKHQQWVGGWVGGWLGGWLGGEVRIYNHSSAQPTGFDNRSKCGNRNPQAIRTQLLYIKQNRPVQTASQLCAVLVVTLVDTPSMGTNRVRNRFLKISTKLQLDNFRSFSLSSYLEQLLKEQKG